MTRSIRSVYLAVLAVVPFSFPALSAGQEKGEGSEKAEKAEKPTDGNDEKGEQKGSAGGTAAPAGRPSLHELLKFNEASIFGGTVTVAPDDVFEVVFNKAGQMARGFEGQIIFDDTSPGAQGANRRFYTHEVAKKQVPIDNLCAVGIPPQATSAFTTWTSRFPVAGDVKVRFNFKVPNLINMQSQFLVRVNAVKDTYVECRFFTALAKCVSGKVAVLATTPLKEYSGPASKWFPRKEENGVPVEIQTAGGKCLVRMKNKDVVTLGKMGNVSAGKVIFAFSKLVFTLQDLHISGKLDRKWAEEQIQTLEKDGKLLLKPPEEKKDDGALPPPTPEPEKKA